MQIISHPGRVKSNTIECHLFHLKYRSGRHFPSQKMVNSPQPNAPPPNMFYFVGSCSFSSGTTYPTSQHLVPSGNCQDLPSLPCQMEPQGRFARDRRADEQGMEAIIVENSVGIIRRIHFRTKLLMDGDEKRICVLNIRDTEDSWQRCSN